MRVLVLDTSAFIMGFNPSQADGAYTVDAVERELVEGSTPYLRLQTSKEKGTLSVLSPTAGASKAVEEASVATGDKGELSKADRDILAVALDLRGSGKDPLIVSDDYAVQNLAEHLRLKYGSLANLGITQKFQWIMYCPACHRRYASTERICRVCGTELRKRVSRKTRVSNA